VAGDLQEVVIVPSLSYETLTVLALTTLAGCVLLAIALAVLALRLSSRLHAVRERYTYLLGGAEDQGDLLAVVELHVAHVGQLNHATQLLSREVAWLRQRVSSLVQTPCVVRYDAFDVPGGQQSFSAALVNEAGDGVVLTGLNTRSDTRVYAKQVSAAASAHNLSAEERRAIGLALGVEPDRLEA
jgi:Protein of unknown function (DUF4446)